MSFLWKKYTICLLLSLFVLYSYAQTENHVVEYETSIQVKEGSLQKEVSILIQVDNKESDWIADIEIPYGKGQKVDILEALILNDRGEVVRKLKKKDIIDKSNISAGTFYDDNFTKSFSLKWNAYPYRVKYSYRTSHSEYLHIARWIPLLYSNVYTHHASLQVEIPFGYKLEMNYAPECSYTVDSLENSYIAKWEIEEVSPPYKELYSPPFRELIPSVNLIPASFNYGTKGSFESWESFGSWLANMNTNIETLTPQEIQKVDALLEGITDPTEQAKALYQYMQQNTRYINVAIDIGGLQPYSASYVCTNKYGDCKALTIYMKALLKHAGIPSYYTIVYAGSNPVRIAPSLPSQQFNHVILCVPMDGDTLWLENTASYLPFNYLGTFTQNRYALLVDGENSYLIKTPAMKMEDVVEKNTYNIHLNTEGVGTIKLSQALKGAAFEKYRYALTEAKEKDQKKMLRRSLPFSDFEWVDMEIKAHSEDERIVEVNASVKVKRQLRKVGRSIVVQAVPSLEMMSKFDKPETREHSLRFPYPIYTIDSMRYELPFLDQYAVELPEDIHIESEYGHYSVSYSKEAQHLMIRRQFQLFKGDYPVEQYADLYAFIEKIHLALKKSVIVLNPS